MPIEADLNNFTPANLIVIRDTETQEMFEVYLLLVPDFEGGQAALAFVESLGNRLIGRVDPHLGQTTTMWRCWINQIRTPRMMAVRSGSTVTPSEYFAIGNLSMLDYSSALACDVVDAYRVNVLGWVPDPEPEPPVARRVSRYERDPVI